MQQGRVYLVGAGPGDPGLITVRGLELVQRADVIIYDRLSASELLIHARKDAERIDVGKQPGHHAIDQGRINALLVEHAQAGKIVVRLKGGDPFVFGRGGEEALTLVAAGIPFEIVPGITASTAAAAYAGIPVTHREIAREFTLITGHRTDQGSIEGINFASLAQQKGTIAIYMGVANIEAICSGLIEHGYPAGTPAAAIRWGTTSKQVVLVGTAETLPDQIAQAELKHPAVIILGEVVRLREQLDWFDPH